MKVFQAILEQSIRNHSYPPVIFFQFSSIFHKIEYHPLFQSARKNVENFIVSWYGNHKNT